MTRSEVSLRITCPPICWQVITKPMVMILGTTDRH